jgi:hypothetical protein
MCRQHVPYTSVGGGVGEWQWKRVEWQWKRVEWQWKRVEWQWKRVEWQWKRVEWQWKRVHCNAGQNGWFGPAEEDTSARISGVNEVAEVNKTRFSAKSVVKGVFSTK